MQQEKASPIEQDTQGPGFDGAYQGSQEASKGIIGTLEVVKSDFERTIKSTEANEKKAAADFVEFERGSKVDSAGKAKKEALNGEDLEKTDAELGRKVSDLQATMDLVGAALMQLEELKP